MHTPRFLYFANDARLPRHFFISSIASQVTPIPRHATTPPASPAYAADLPLPAELPPRYFHRRFALRLRLFTILSRLHEALFLDIYAASHFPLSIDFFIITARRI